MEAYGLLVILAILPFPFPIFIFFFLLFFIQHFYLEQGLIHSSHGHTDSLDILLNLQLRVATYCVYLRPLMIWQRISIDIGNIVIIECQGSGFNEVMDPLF